MQLAHGYIQHRIIGIEQMQKLLQSRRAIGILLPHIKVHQAFVAPNAVLRVHHRIAHFQLAQIFDQRFYIAGLLLALSAAHIACGGE